MPSLEEIVRPDRSAVVVIDMQNDYVHRDGAVMRYFRVNEDSRDIGPVDEPTVMEQMVPRLVQLIDAARQAQVSVIWVRTINDANTQSPFAAAQGKRFAWADDAWGTAFYEGLDPQPGEPLVTKHRHSAFFGTDLDIILSRLGVRTVILTGVSTPYCVESTARDAFARDYQVVSVADCTASKVVAEHEAALTRLSRVFGRVEMAERIESVWRLRLKPGD